MSAAHAETARTAGARPRSAPAFRSALIESGPGGVVLRPRRLRGGLALSIVAHVFGAMALMGLSLFSVEAIPAPPIVIHFLAAPPPPPRLVPQHPASKPAPEPAPRSLPIVAKVPPLALEAPPPRRPPEPPRLQVDAAPKLRPADIEPEPRTLDMTPARPRGGPPALGALAATPDLPGGRDEEPDLVFLTAGRSRPRGPGGGLAGPGDGLPTLAPADDSSGLARGGRSRGRRSRAGGGAGAVDAEAGGDGGDGVPEDGTGLAAFLGRRYGAALVEAARLGQRTSDGARYNMLVPMLTEAYRQIAFRGAWRAAGSDAHGVVSAQVDRDAVAIHYHDGTLHVIVPTHDGLVALYVSADQRAGGGRTKVDEAERALEALRRLAQVRS